MRPVRTAHFGYSHSYSAPPRISVAVLARSSHDEVPLASGFDPLDLDNHCCAFSLRVLCLVALRRTVIHPVPELLIVGDAPRP